MFSSDFTLLCLQQFLAKFPDLPPDFWSASDTRQGVKKLRREFEQKKQNLQQEKQRLHNLLAEENYWRKQGYVQVAGVDEAGRGPLAGSVMAAAVILPPEIFLPGLNDSKKLGSGFRKDLARAIKKTALAWSVQEASVEEIDHLNILEASRLAMRRAIANLRPVPDLVLTDGNIPCLTEFGQEKTIIGGDQKCACIAAASILAKVARDQLMLELDQLYPQYGFARHKGYGTPEHLAALKRYGACPWHRQSFKPVQDSRKDLFPPLKTT